MHTTKKPALVVVLIETMGALDQAVRQGKSLYVGISSYTPEQTTHATAILKQLGTPCLIHQPQYSMLNRQIENKLLDVLTNKGIGCIVFCPLAQGLLTDKYLSGIPKDSRAAKPHGFLKREQITEELLKKIRSLNQVAADRGQTLAQMALAWILRDRRVTSVLVGASKIKQIKENIAAFENTEFTTDELNQIDKILEQD